MTWTGPAFVDNHTHILEVAAGIPEPWEETGVAEYHRRLKARGLMPFEDQIGAPLPEQDLGSVLQSALELTANSGVARISELGIPDWTFFDTLSELRDAGPLPVAVWLYPICTAVDPRNPRSTGDDNLDVKGVKLYADGWIGPRTAAVTEEYQDDPGNKGILFLDAERILRLASRHAEAGLTLVTHAIGDRAIDEVLDAYERLFGDECAEHAPRLEHASMLRDDQIERIARLGVVCSIQASFAVSEVESLRRLGSKAHMVYRWQELLDAGVRMVGGTDHPVETAEPLVALRDLSTGTELDGRQAGRLPSRDALAIMTDATAGRMMLSDDPAMTPVEELPSLRVLETVAAPG